MLWRITWVITMSCFLLMFDRVMAQQKNWAKAKKDTLRVELVETGEVGAVNSTVVTTPMIWSQDLQIIDLAPEGIHVDSGAVLVQLDRVSLSTQLQGKQTELDGHRSDMLRLQTEQSNRIREMERSVEMAEHTLQLAHVQLEQMKYESASRQEQGKLEVLKAEIALKEAKTKLEAQAIIHHAEEKKQQLKILQAQNQANESKRQLEQLTLRAPISGMVVHHPDWNGNKPTIGEKIRPGRGVIDLPDLSRMQVKIRVNEVDAARLQTNQPARISLDAFPNKQFRGRLISTTRIASKKAEESQVNVFEAIVEIAGSDSLLKPGMTAQVRIEDADARSALVVPTEAVIRTGTRTMVIVANESGYAPTEVQLGRQSGDNIEIRNGLSEGQRVVASGQFLIDSEASLSGALERLQASNAAPDEAAATLHTGSGRVTAVSSANITIAHGPIASLSWPAMTMQFSLVRPEAAQGIRVGDSVAFRFRQNGGAYVIEEINKTGAPR